MGGGNTGTGRTSRSNSNTNTNTNTNDTSGSRRSAAPVDDQGSSNSGRDRSGTADPEKL